MKNRIKRGIQTAVLALMLGTVFVPLHAKAALPEVTYDANAKKTGYHLEVDVRRDCKHDARKNTKTVACELNGLNRSLDEIRSAVTSTGGLGYELTFDGREPQGELSHMVGRVVCTVYVPTAGMYLELAGPYWCPDGYAGYAYYRHYFSHCVYTEKDYFVASQHSWFGCAREDVGGNEFHEREYSHTLTRYKFVANNYTVRYNGNGSTSGTLTDQKPEYDQKFNLRKNGYKKSGYIFTGWNTKADGKGTSYTEGQKVKNLTKKDGGTVVLYAQWKANNYTVTYNGNGATGGSTANQTMTYNKAAKLRANGFTKTGYTFTGWNTKANGTGTAFKNKQSVKNLRKTAGTYTLHAQWKKNITISYDANGGSGAPPPQTQTIYNSTTSANFTLSATKPTRVGYTFLGWSKDKLATTPSYGSGATYPFSDDTTLFAIWKFDLNVVANIKRMIAPQGTEFLRGQSGILTITTYGYAERLTVKFPDGLNMEGEFNRDYALDTNIASYTSNIQFMVPLYCTEGNYNVEVTVYKEGETKTVYPEMSVNGTVLDTFRTRIRSY